MKKRLVQSEEGKALLIVLIIIGVFGLILTGLMTESGASLRFTNAVSAHEAKVYAADAGISVGIQQLRQNNEVCPTVGVGGPAISSVTIDSPIVGPRTVDISCSVTSGSTFGGEGFAVVTTSTDSDSLDLQGGNEVKKIRGAVYVGGGVQWNKGLDVERGNFYHRAGAGVCAAGGPKPADLTVDQTDGYRYVCVDPTVVPQPNPAHNPPGTAPTVAATFIDSGSCRIFSPGVFNAPPTLLATNYFASGVYYFNFNGTFSIDHAVVYGGHPAADEQRRLTPVPACALNDPSPVAGSSGVEFVFGGGSRMAVDTQGTVELFSRRGESGAATNNISVIPVPNEATWTSTGWTANSLAVNELILEIKEGNQQDLTVHGLIYAPRHKVGLAATNDVIAQALGGIVASKLALKSSASASGLAVSIADGVPTPRNIVLTATAQGVEAGERPVVSTAVIEIGNEASKPVTVKSWRTRGPSDS